MMAGKRKVHLVIELLGISNKTELIPLCCVDGIFKAFCSSEHQLGTTLQKPPETQSLLVTAWAVIPPGLSLLDLTCQMEVCHVLAGLRFGFRGFVSVGFGVFFPLLNWSSLTVLTDSFSLSTLTAPGARQTSSGLEASLTTTVNPTGSSQ